MEATVARIREAVRRRLSGEKVWKVGVSVTPDTVRVTLYSPDKPERFLALDEKSGESVSTRLGAELKGKLGRNVFVDAVQSPMAVARFIRISPRKCRAVVDTVRGKPVQDALAILKFLPNSAAKTVSKLIKSAIANAENNHRMDGETLEVLHVHVDDGPTLKRLSERAMGRAYRIMKRTSHITVGLGESEKPSRLAKKTKGVARTVGKAPVRRGGRAASTAAHPEAAKPKRAAKPAEAKADAAAPKTKAPRKRAPKKQEGTE